ncbi:hypothetical protein [Yinghuangia sp. YIM S09857]|uniref:hypothetical protein n=1 Tax=Yinghuangia sp. YIM S09857 TaxID=3436929 RepID=UPI003F52C0C5
MNHWDATTLVVLDKTDDQGQGQGQIEDGLSRLEAYLSKRADHHDQFRDYDGSQRNSRDAVRRCIATGPRQCRWPVMTSAHGRHRRVAVPNTAELTFDVPATATTTEGGPAAQLAAADAVRAAVDALGFAESR